MAKQNLTFEIGRPYRKVDHVRSILSDRNDGTIDIELVHRLSDAAQGRLRNRAKKATMFPWRVTYIKGTKLTRFSGRGFFLGYKISPSVTDLNTIVMTLRICGEVNYQDA